MGRTIINQIKTNKKKEKIRTCAGDVYNEAKQLRDADKLFYMHHDNLN